jgi:hypothetical protein
MNTDKTRSDKSTDFAPAPALRALMIKLWIPRPHGRGHFISAFLVSVA